MYSLLSVAKDHVACALSAGIAGASAWLILYNLKFNDSNTEFHWKRFSHVENDKQI